MEKMLLENPKLFVTILIIALIWTLPWKAWALWRSARRGQLGWFVAMLVVNTLGILEILYIFIFSRRNKDKLEQDVAQENPIQNISVLNHDKHDMQKPKMVL